MMGNSNIADTKVKNGSLEAKKTNDTCDSTTFEEALEITRVGTYNYRLLTITIYSLLAATAEMFSVGIVSTASQCDLELDVGKKGLISSIPILGVVVSAHFWGFVADTRGRRFALIISTTGTCVAGIIATFSNNWILLAVIKFIGAALLKAAMLKVYSARLRRFMHGLRKSTEHNQNKTQGILASGTNALVFTFLGEATIASKRQTYLMYASAGVLSFQAFNAALAYPILNLTFDYYMPLLGFSFRPWRLFLLVIGLISGLNVLLIVFFTYESPKFCFAIGEHKRGLKIMQKIYKVNTGNAFEDYPVKHVVLNADDYKTKNGTFLRSVWDQTVPLFSKKYIKNTVLIFLCGLPAYCVSPPFSIWLPFIFNAYSTTSNPDLQFCETFQKNFTQSANRTMIPVCDDSVADITLVALAIFAVYLTLCSLSTVLIIKFIGKKWTFVLNHLFSCIMCVIINRVPILFGFVAMVGMTANVACMGIVTTYAIELFPTYMRAMAVCLCILSGRSVSIVFYNVIGAQLENNCDNFIVIIAGLILFGGIVGLFLPSDRVLIKADDIEKPSENCETNAELKKHFNKCREGKIRVMKISIENEQLTLAKYLPTKGSWEQDFDKYLPGMIVDDMPCYLLYRFDTTNSVGHEWLLLSWSPDDSPVRHKMLYASTKATLKQEFGSAHIKDEMHATTKVVGPCARPARIAPTILLANPAVKQQCLHCCVSAWRSEVSLRGYKAHLSGISAPAPLTEREEALKELQQSEHSTNYGTDSRQSTIGGVSFPITEAAEQGVLDLQRGSYNYVQFRIDLEEEKIHLSKAANISLVNLPEQVPSDQARYHLFVFKHSHEGDHMASIVFIYSMPGYNCSIKERMMYSSCKGQFLDIIEKMGLEVAKRIEIDDGKELTEEFLYDEIHPKRNLHRPAFAKPKGPPNRGAKRITKSQTAQ
ncbi:hypothetical protein MSG28_007311 [Choristoneura fumiferana]|uniref:Uncharacterized protein n=1 Tax=Choristoneura fumiferana TaxID=7141 RepID=A0ACC0JX83_CHOFU|nr:hypothetical protein MSG28_007311 [Choristoneura fumiferana]